VFGVTDGDPAAPARRCDDVPAGACRCTRLAASAGRARARCGHWPTARLPEDESVRRPPSCCSVGVGNAKIDGSDRLRYAARHRFSLFPYLCFLHLLYLFPSPFCPFHPFLNPSSSSTTPPLYSTSLDIPPPPSPSAPFSSFSSPPPPPPPHYPQFLTTLFLPLNLFRRLSSLLLFLSSIYSFARLYSPLPPALIAPSRLRALPLLTRLSLFFATSYSQLFFPPLSRCVPRSFPSPPTLPSFLILSNASSFLVPLLKFPFPVRVDTSRSSPGNGTVVAL